MKTRLLFLFFLLSLAFPIKVRAQVEIATEADSLLIIEAAEILGFAKEDTTQGWSFSGIVGVDFGQNGVSNWISGGENSVSADAYASAFLEFRNKKFSWDNYLFLNYGTIFSEGRNWQKASDRILVSSMAGYHNTRNWAYSFLIDFSSQFNKGFIYPDETDHKSNFMAPAYSNISLGINYKSNRRFAFFASPLTLRTTFCLDTSLSDIGAFGVHPGDRMKADLGTYLILSTSQHLWDNVDIVSKVDFFTPYSSDFGNISLNWDILVVVKIHRMLSCSLNATVRYYDEEIKKIQARDIFGLGFAYKF